MLHLRWVRIVVAIIIPITMVFATSYFLNQAFTSHGDEAQASVHRKPRPTPTPKPTFTPTPTPTPTPKPTFTPTPTPTIPVPTPTQTSDKVVYLTFDDGPDPLSSPTVLADLQQTGAHATFFDLGNQTDWHPDIVRNQLLAGNAVGVHSYDHTDYTTLTDAQQQMETMDAKQAIRNATGTDATLFRYPYGKSTAFTDSQLSSWGFTAPAVYWTYAPEDWYPLCPSAATIQQRLLSNITNGSVILLHDVSYCGVDQFDYLVPTINALKSQGYAFGILGPNLYPPNPSSVTSHG